MSPSQIASYTILPLAMPPIPSYPHQTTHTLYLRPHEPKIPTPDDARSLFLVNVPIDSTAAHFRSVFSSLIGAGKFESCSFEHERTSSSSDGILIAHPTGTKKRKRGEDNAADLESRGVELPSTWDRELRRSGSTVVVVLADEKSVELCLKSIAKLHRKAEKPSKKKEEDRNIWPIWGSNLPAIATGSARYALHNKLKFPSERELQQNVDSFITAFNEREEEEREGDKRRRNEPDEDGFVTVSRGGRVGPARAEEVERKRVEMEEKEKKKREELGDFYRFQMREKRKEQQGEMVRRFEEDRRKVEELKGKRRGMFVPEK